MPEVGHAVIPVSAILQIPTHDIQKMIVRIGLCSKHRAAGGIPPQGLGHRLIVEQRGEASVDTKQPLELRRTPSACHFQEDKYTRIPAKFTILAGWRPTGINLSLIHI